MREIQSRYGSLLKAFEQALHRRPELAFAEAETTVRIKEALLPLGMELIDLSMETGVVARLCGACPGPTVGLRADIDGIQQQEAVDRPDRSQVDGLMHACGHDVHAASLLGAAMALAELRERIHGNVVFIFQPAEETIAGANEMIRHGLLEKTRLDALFGLHNQPDLTIGQVGLKHGTLMAAKDDFAVSVRGRGGHGGLPERCVDPIVAACGMVGALQTVVSRNVSPRDAAALSVCSIHGGEASNLVPDEVRFTGCVRSFDVAVQARIMDRIREIVSGCAKAYGCAAELDHYATMRPLVNDEALYDIAEQAALRTVGREGLREPETSIASEDFAAYGPLVKSFYYFLGSGFPGRDNASWHSAHFAAHPDTAYYGAALLKNAALCALERL